VINIYKGVLERDTLYDCLHVILVEIGRLNFNGKGDMNAFAENYASRRLKKVGT
jgi:hypothetical protein